MSIQTISQHHEQHDGPLTAREYLMLAVIAVLLLIIAGLVVFGDGYGMLRTEERHGYVTNLFTEGISVFVTVVVLGFWQTVRARENLKQTLIRNTKKGSNDIVLDALDELKHYGWLTEQNGLLRGQQLSRAQMQGADLRDANLQGAKLSEAKLEGADLRDANLQGADLRNANLQGADLRNANLQGAKLSEARLEGADLRDANLQGADLRDTNLTNATLPNDEIYSKAINLQKFTDPKHPEFDRKGL